MHPKRNQALIEVCLKKMAIKSLNKNNKYFFLLLYFSWITLIYLGKQERNKKMTQKPS